MIAYSVYIFSFIFYKKKGTPTYVPSPIVLGMRGVLEKKKKLSTSQNAKYVFFTSNCTIHLAFITRDVGVLGQCFTLNCKTQLSLITVGKYHSTE